MGLANLREVARRVLKALAAHVMPDARDELSMVDVGIWATCGTDKAGHDIPATLVPWRGISFATVDVLGRWAPLNTPVNAPILLLLDSHVTGWPCDVRLGRYSTSARRWETITGAPLGTVPKAWAYPPQEA